MTVKDKGKQTQHAKTRHGVYVNENNSKKMKIKDDIVKVSEQMSEEED